jgi:hypothetical protein
MSSAAYQYYKDLPPWARGTIIVGGGLVVFLIGKSIWNAVQQAKAFAASLKEAKDAVSYLNQLGAQGIKPTYSDAQFEGWSSDIAQALGGCSTTDGTLESVFSNMNNDADLYKLIAVYGTRTISGCVWIFKGSENLSLSAAMSKEVSTGFLGIINSILAAKSITFRFS